MDLDREIVNYLMEFYLPQPVVVPVPSDNLRFQKPILLKKLEFELLKPVSETALELMERLAEVGVVSDAMRRAYCLVAVDCTLRRVKLRQDASEFFYVVKRLWRGRIGRVVESEAEGGLGSELLREWKDMIETALWDDSVCDCVLKKFEGVSAVEAVKVYVREEWAKMGTSFLELVAEAVNSDQGLQKIMGVHGQAAIGGRAADMAASGSNPTEGSL